MTAIERRDCIHLVCHVLVKPDCSAYKAFEDACGTTKLPYTLPFQHLRPFPGRPVFYATGDAIWSRNMFG